MARKIMIQGTMSNAGKSIVAAALCRIFAQDGYKVAPFKSQNMALNSYITKDGLEMGRAQVVQAEAAGIEPDAAMNPILLKPTSDISSQVIVNGRVWENMSAKEYYKNKRVLVPEIKKAFEKLDEEYDIIVIEGAGSPVEINLKENDIVNMAIAQMTDAPVLLVGDIDRGGVFASLAGTMMLFDENEKKRVKGLVINKFRGDVTILEPGLKTLEEITATEVIGVVPYLDIDIDDEDSLSERLNNDNALQPIDIVAIRLPRLSNFTDLNVFSRVKGVSVRYVDSWEKIGNPDMICIPGSKNTMADLKWMRENGIEATVKKLAAAGTPVFGICGGYQMLGKKLEDPYGAEEGGNMRGMELLPISTVFQDEKTTSRVKGAFRNMNGIFSELSGMLVEGYEIHMGISDCAEGTDMIYVKSSDGMEKCDGCCCKNVYGSYIHGLFDSPGIAEKIVEILMRKKGLDPKEYMIKDRVFSAREYREIQYNLLAEGVRKALNIERIYEIMGINIKKNME